jgi:transketolase
MEGIAKWHHGMPSEEQYQQAISEISARIEQLKSI